VAYLYETHLHTAEASKCAVSGGADYITVYKEMGYTGIMVTDHFYNGNCALSRNLPWEEWVNRFYKGYENAKREGDKQGLDVFFGWEESFDYCDDYLIYGLDKQWLLDHPEVRTWTRGEQYRAVRDAGGCVVQAHPFRQRYYISSVILSAGCVDAVEAANGGHDDVSYDALAYRYAKKIGKPILAGTDIHDADSAIYSEVYGVYLEKKLNTIDDYVKLILNNDIINIKVDNYRLDFHGHEKVRLPVEIRDVNDKIISRNWKEYI
jgi:hypothetical protein